MNAHDILNTASQHMLDRADTYDKPQGERSMAATVSAFNAVTGHDLTEEQGWLFMALLKAVRSQQGNYRADSYEDGAAYFALAGETSEKNRSKGKHIDDDFDEARADIIGQNGNDGAIYFYDFDAGGRERVAVRHGAYIRHLGVRHNGDSISALTPAMAPDGLYIKQDNGRYLLAAKE